MKFKNMIKGLTFASVLAMATPALSQVAVDEYEMQTDQDAAEHEIFFKAEIEQNTILRIGHAGSLGNYDDVSAAGNFVYYAEGFAFGTSNGGTDPVAWENFSIPGASLFAGDPAQLELDVCGDPLSPVANQILDIHEGGSFEPQIAGAANAVALSGSCSVDSNDVNAMPVSASVEIGFEVIAGGGSSMTLSVSPQAGVDYTLDGTNNVTGSTVDAALDFATFSATVPMLNDASGADVELTRGTVDDEMIDTGVDLQHGDYGKVALDLGFDLIGPNSKSLQRGSLLFVGVASFQ